MKKTAQTYLKENFPDAVLITEGLDHGKFETADYLFDLDHEFYTSKTTGQTFFLANRSWKDLLPELKAISKKYNQEVETNLIV